MSYNINHIKIQTPCRLQQPHFRLSEVRVDDLNKVGTRKSPWWERAASIPQRCLEQITVCVLTEVQPPSHNRPAQDLLSTFHWLWVLILISNADF